MLKLRQQDADGGHKERRSYHVWMEIFPKELISKSTDRNCHSSIFRFIGNRFLIKYSTTNIAYEIENKRKKSVDYTSSEIA